MTSEHAAQLTIEEEWADDTNRKSVKESMNGNLTLPLINLATHHTRPTERPMKPADQLSDLYETITLPPDSQGLAE